MKAQQAWCAQDSAKQEWYATDVQGGREPSVTFYQGKTTVSLTASKRWISFFYPLKDTASLSQPRARIHVFKRLAQLTT